MRKKLVSLVLAFTLALGLTWVPAAAASPTFLPDTTPYYGSLSRCKITSDMAVAYAAALAKVPASAQAMLVDIAGDGVPLLAVANVSASPSLSFWTWDGTTASKYDFSKDSDLNAVWDFTFETCDGQPVLVAHDGVMQWMGNAQGHNDYTVKNGQLTLLHRTVVYSAYAEDGKTAVGQLLPLVQGAVKFTDYGSPYYKAPVSALLKAGWGSVGSNIYTIGVEDGTYVPGVTAESFQNGTHSHTGSASSILDGDTGELLGNWGTASSLRSTLISYSQLLTGSFSDVPAGHYAYDAVTWAIDKNITNGTGSGKFSPDSTCTTGQILTFLYRALEEPAWSGQASLEDAQPTDYFYNAVHWAKEQGLLTGEYSYPASDCTRAQVVTYLWKLAGSPVVSGGTSFSDVAANSDYAQAVRWAVKNGVTDGTSATTFSPNQICTRAQIVTFLYRVYG